MCNLLVRIKDTTILPVFQRITLKNKHLVIFYKKGAQYFESAVMQYRHIFCAYWDLSARSN